MRTAQDLLTELNASDESHRIEAKRAREIGKSVMETVIAFANEPGLGGGYLLLGVDWTLDANGDTRYWAVGIPDPDKTQGDLATQCASMLNVAVRPEMAVERVDGKTVLVVFVPEVDASQKPVYLQATGLPKGACRDFSGLDTLQASNLLRRLRDRGLLEKQGAGNRTHYTLVNPGAVTDRHPEQGNLPLEGGKRSGEGGNQLAQGGKRDLPPLPPALEAMLPASRQRMGEATLRQLIRDLCGWQALRGEELATLLRKDLKYLRNKHLSVMVQSGELVFQYPESPNHALQAYIAVPRD